jgi:asparagine synthase (glutamine-hydrolysing)
MCGITGELRFDSRPPAADMAQLVALMTRRGPDGQGVWTDDRACTLAFRRLAILDLSTAADQPMVSPDGRFALVYNGELYNYRELRAELIHRGVGFRSSGDTEVVLQSLIVWGKAALDRFNGMFALALYDGHEQTLLLARDHAGIKPLYTLLTGEGLAFASQYDQILAHPWARGLGVRPEALGLYLRLGYIPAPYAVVQQTAMLEPGCWLEATVDGRVTHGRYYAFPTFARPDLAGDEAYEAVDAAVAAAVQRQMVSDVPLGTFLSGGIDSPLVAAKTVHAGAPALKAFTIGTAGSQYDESANARRYAAALGLTHRLEDYTPDMALSYLDQVVEACSEPLADYSIFPTLLVSGMARREVTVVLSGDGGDELFWGYARRFGDVIGQAERFGRPYWMRTGRRAAHKLMGSGNGSAALRWPTIGDWYRSVHTRLSDPVLNGVFTGLAPWPDDYDLFAYAGSQQDETAQWLRWNESVGHLTRVLLKVDRASMYHSLEVRVPLLDREVVDIAARVDWRSCLDLDSSLGKLPLRRALDRHIEFQSQAKLGFSVPMDEWLRGPLLPIFRDKVLGRPEILGLPVNRPALERILTDHVSGRIDYSRWLWTVLSLILWDERYLQR